MVEYIHLFFLFQALEEIQEKLPQKSQCRSLHANVGFRNQTEIRRYQIHDERFMDQNDPFGK